MEPDVAPHEVEDRPLDGARDLLPACVSQPPVRLVVADRRQRVEDVAYPWPARAPPAPQREQIGVAHPSDHSRTAHVVPTPAGAIVTYDAARVGDGGAIPFRVLEARTVRCVAR